jgi:SH3-like domain-containing protein
MASKQPLPPQAPLPPLTGSEIGSTVDPAKDHPVAIPIASTISDVRMRAGPGNGQAVLATIPKGRPVEVIECRQWCEVIFAGQRGWVYKSFIGPPSIARRP